MVLETRNQAFPTLVRLRLRWPARLVTMLFPNVVYIHVYTCVYMYRVYYIYRKYIPHCGDHESRCLYYNVVYVSMYCTCTVRIWERVYEKRDLACFIKKYNKNALRLICYNFRTVKAINFLFPTLHTAPFLYGKIYFGVLHLLCVSIATFDTPLGSNPP